ncbi:unnamed protein product [Ambrosiozyma monospora]|uniref:Unnamed protein product n=1 Tax=Ambrosiozyma monospora TaxID=43982 RepID=A0ACB5T4H9_AMBMO|nr:unnamed protein product [Ambrosiozyma monospora]
MREISRCNPDLNVMLEMSKDKIEVDELEDVDVVVVVNVPTLDKTIGRLKKFKPSTFKAIIIDECHHAMNSSYLKILSYFGCYEAKKGEIGFDDLKPDNTEDVAHKGDVAVIGFSATLKRHDGIPLKKVFDYNVHV